MKTEMNDSEKDKAWKLLIAEANEDECIKRIGELYQKWEYLRTIAPMLKGQWMLKN